MLSSQRHLFTLPDDQTYLNCSYFSPLLKSQRQVMAGVLDQQENPAAIKIGDFFEPPNTLRGMLGQLLNAPAEQVALVPSVSYGVAIATHNLKLRRGQNVVVPEGEFPSDVYAWQGVCAESGAELRTVPRPVDAQRTAQAWNTRLLEAIDADTAVLNLTAVHWADGVRFDLPALRARTREVDAAFILDGTQSVGAAPLDWQAVQPDLLVCAGYKWMLGAYGLSYAVVGERFLDGKPLENNWANRVGSDQTGSSLGYLAEYEPGARRFDMGQRASFLLLPLFIEGVRQLLEWTPEGIQAYTGTLVAEAERLLADSPFSILPGTERHNHLWGIRMENPDWIPAIQKEMAQRQISISYRGTALRISPHVYNTTEDIQRLVDALRAVV